MAHRILLVDEHRIMRDGVKAILERNGEFVVDGEAGNGPDAVQLCRKSRPDLVLMEIALPGMAGAEVATELRRLLPATKVVILSMYDDDPSVIGAIRAGASAYILKRASGNDLLEALRTVMAGGSYLSPQISDQLLRRIRRGEIESEQPRKSVESLGPREIQVLRLVAEGRTSKEIAVLLNLGYQTVRSYRKTVMRKLGVGNAAALTQLAIAAGVTRLSRP